MLKKIKLTFNYNHEKYENILEDPHNKIWVFSSRFITFLIVLFAFVISFESIWENQFIYYNELFYFDWFISIVFALEYFYRLLRAKNKISFIFNPIRIIDLLSFLPFFLGLVAIWDYLRVLRLLRILRILRLIKEIPLTAWFIKSLKDYKDEYKAVFILFLVILFIGSSFVYFTESNVVWTKFTSIPISLWWGLVTMTSVWFWDMIPNTNIWKFIWSFLVFIWPLLLALVSAVTIMVFMDNSKRQATQLSARRWKKCEVCNSRNNLDSNYCSKCWNKLF